MRNVITTKALLFLLVTFFFASYVEAQSRPSGNMLKDSLATLKLSTESGLSFAKVKKIKQIMSYRQRDIARAVIIPFENRVQQQAAIKAAGFERRYKLDSLLTREERALWWQREEELRKKQNIKDSILVQQQREQMREPAGQINKQD